METINQLFKERYGSHKDKWDRGAKKYDYYDMIEFAEAVKDNAIPPDKPEPDKTVCDHDYVYKILHDHTAADVCTKCGNIKKQQTDKQEPEKMDAEEWQLTKLRQILIRVFHHEMEGNMLEDYVQDIHQQYANHIKPEPAPSHCACSERQKHGETSVMCCNECGKPTEKFWSCG